MATVTARKPIVEIAGLELRIVLDNEELWRIASPVTVPLTELVVAFSRHAHTEIQQAFRSMFENAVGSKHQQLSDEGSP